MIDTHPRLYRALIILIVFLALACAWWPLPLRASAPPILTITTMNERGTPDLFPGQRVMVVIMLRSEEAHTAFAQHLAPDGLVLEHAEANTGALVTDPFPSWTGAISGTQPLIIVLSYRVAPDAPPGDRMIRAQAQIGGQLLRASNILRVCCIPAPPAQQSGYRRWLPLVRA